VNKFTASCATKHPSHINSNSRWALFNYSLSLRWFWLCSKQIHVICLTNQSKILFCFPYQSREKTKPGISSILVVSRSWHHCGINWTWLKKCLTLTPCHQASEQIGLFRVTPCLCIKTIFRVTPFIWKCVWFTRKWTCKGNIFSRTINRQIYYTTKAKKAKNKLSNWRHSSHNLLWGTEWQSYMYKPTRNSLNHPSYKYQGRWTSVSRNLITPESFPGFLP